MSTLATDAPSRVGALLVGLVATALLALTPTLGIESSSAVTAAVLALVVTALAAPGRASGALPLWSGSAPPAASHDAGSGLCACATDPVHHPRRPRAPGTA